VHWKMGFSNNNEKLEDSLNQHAKASWSLKHIGENSLRIIFERDKIDNYESF